MSHLIRSRDQCIYLLAVIGLVLLILFLQPTLVGGVGSSTVCGGNGYFNSSNGLCICLSGYYGYNCQLRYCPAGTSWYSDPITNSSRFMPSLECSNMGFCNHTSGICKCRPGFEGRACERWACFESGSDSISFLLSADLAAFPIRGVSIQGFLDITKTSGGDQLPLYTAVGSRSNLNLVPGSGVSSVSLRPCGGRGTCRSMREIASRFDGM